MNITIGRLESDPSAQMVIQPEDGRWQVVVDKDGYPHLYVEVNVEAGEDTGGKPVKGMFCIEDMLPCEDGVQTTIRDLMEGSFGGECTPEEKARAAEEFARGRAETGIPCPRPLCQPKRRT